MYRKERIDRIMNILRVNGYVNVKYLCSEIGYSKATINRDLSYMEKQKMIIRSYGGVEIIDKNGIPLEFRYHKMKNEKMHICKVAADLVKDGDTIFIDSSSTTEFMASYLKDKKNLKVITSNMAIATYLGTFSNIKVVCLGGEIIEHPSMLGGDLSVKNAMSYKADKFFFATKSINEAGEIGGSGAYSLLISVMAENSKQVIYLADHSKVNLGFEEVIMTVADVDIIVTDHIFDESFKKKYAKTKFLEAE